MTHTGRILLWAFLAVDVLVLGGIVAREKWRGRRPPDVRRRIR
ncbi:MAG TPA: hypothetical protein VII51_02055 [Gaiellaceae bacterium]